MVIRATDRVDRVLARDERLLEVFISVSPAFVRLRSPVLRRTMTRLVTVEQAARIVGIAPDHLLARLNLAADPHVAPDKVPSESASDMPPGAGTPEAGPLPMPPLLRELDRERIVDLDVREDLRAGREPFSRIMQARRSLAPAQVLRVHAIFDPVPLYQVLARQGLEHWTERLAEDHWRVWFYPAAAAEPTQPRAASGTGCETHASPDDDAVVVIDVRGLEPPEPMMRTLAALDRLPRGSTLVQINVRVPQFLLPQLEERGFVWEVREQSEDLVRLFIRRRES
jgi:uncharacterized protein (DUF2249 family)